MSHDDYQPGMSTTAKVIIALVAAGCIGLLLCCGGAWWLGLRFQEFVGEMADSFEEAVTQDPDEIRALTDSMISIDVPEGWQPLTGMEFSFGTEMTTVTYSPNQMQPNRMLTLMQMRGQGADQQQLEQQMQTGHPQFGVPSSETRTYQIDGEERTFQFVVFNDQNGGKVHQVSGVFPGRNGIVMLTFMEDDANWDEEAVVQMIESITTEESAAESPDMAAEPTDSSSDPTETIPEASEPEPAPADATGEAAEQ